MGWLSDIAGAVGLSSGTKQGTFIEGRASKEHTHNDGSSGRDIYAAKVSYKDGEKVAEKDAKFGHISENSPNGDHVK